ncbi:hypothetical protein V493_07561, partial [Pseudogymnoascus sp. VKM F-4281 (FW-2241)]
MTKDFENLMSDEKKPKDQAPQDDEQQRALENPGGYPPQGQYGAPQPPYGG